MNRGLIMLLYLSDQLLSALLPFSSGPFAIGLVLLCAQRAKAPRPARRELLIASATALCAGTVGGLSSGTPVGAFFLATVALLTTLWLTGSGLDRRDSVLVTSRLALIGVLTSVAFLLLALFGWDAMSVVRGIPANRVAGLYMEPSHLALFVMPLWMIAWRCRRYRPPLCCALALIVVFCFSTTLVLFILGAQAFRFYLDAKIRGIRLADVSKRLAYLAGLGAVAVALSSVLTVADVTLRDYVQSRVVGLLNPGDADNYNLSSLVVVQGIELAGQSFAHSFGLGVGLGNFGTSERIVDSNAFRLIINTVTDGADISLRDGGLLVSKLFGELGLLSLAFVWLLVSHFRTLKREPRSRFLAYHDTFAVALTCLLFTRALPYFAAPVCLALVSMAGLRSAERRRAPLRSRRAAVSPFLVITQN